MTSTCGDYKIVRTIGFNGNAVSKLVRKEGDEYVMKIFELPSVEREEMIAKIRYEMKIVQKLNLSIFP